MNQVVTNLLQLSHWLNSQQLPPNSLIRRMKENYKNYSIGFTLNPHNRNILSNVWWRSFPSFSNTLV